MPRRDIVRRDVAAIATAAQCHGGVETGRETDRSVRRGGIDNDAECRLFETELEDDVLILRVNGHRVAHATVTQNLFAAFTSIAPILDNIEGQDRTELLD